MNDLMYRVALIVAVPRGGLGVPRRRRLVLGQRPAADGPAWPVSRRASTGAAGALRADHLGLAILEPEVTPACRVLAGLGGGAGWVQSQHAVLVELDGVRRTCCVHRSVAAWAYESTSTYPPCVPASTYTYFTVSAAVGGPVGAQASRVLLSDTRRGPHCKCIGWQTSANRP